jgi:magnesium-transporting ATPase (P-type)
LGAIPCRGRRRRGSSVFFRQFLSPLIYILLIAAVVSVALPEWSDAIFIFAVLLINAVIGTIQEYSAERSAEALRQLVAPHARVLRDDDAFEIDAEELVLGLSRAAMRRSMR